MDMVDEPLNKWIEENFARGCHKKDMYDTLVQGGFDHGMVAAKLGLESNVVVAKPETDYLYIPRCKDVHLPSFNIKVVEDFLHDNECVDLQLLMRNDAAESEKNYHINNYPFVDTNHAIVADIDKRLNQLIGIDEQYARPIQGITVNHGETQTEGKDEYYPELEGCSHLLILFLNEPYHGGEVKLTDTDQVFKPERGTLMVFEVLGENDQAGQERKILVEKISKGYHSFLVKKIYNPKDNYNKTPNEYLPAYTKSGFIKRRMPEQLFNQIRAFYYGNIDTTIEESDKHNILSKKKKLPSEVIQLPNELSETIKQTLHPIVEVWMGKPITPLFVFGVRRYLDTSELVNHRDHEKTHIAGVILNIDQDVRAPWPLYIEDHHYRGHEIFLQPGEMVIYESCKLAHGRPKPLEGNFFCNVFAHFEMKN